VRVDTGVFEGGEISMFYDPMIAKLVTGGATRDEAIARMRHALDAFHIRGISHNIPFLASVLAHPRFVAGRLSTGFIEEEYPDGLHQRPLTDGERLQVLAIAGALQQREAARRAGISGRLNGPAPKEPSSWVIRTGGEDHPVELHPLAEGCRVTLWDGGKKRDFRVTHDWVPGDALFQGRIDDAPVCVQVDRRGIGWRLSHVGIQADVQVVSPRTAALAHRMPEKVPPDLSRFLLSPMPGLLLRLAVAEGDSVKAGEELAVVEAMKMENVLRAERDGVIKKINAGPGDSLAVDQSILEFE
jgi:propionyl-CoA carboxylase alpha chain